MNISTTVCTTCGTRQPVEAGFLDDDAKRIIGAFFAADPQLGRAALGYMRLFKPPQTELRLPKALKLLQELLVLAQVGRVSADDRTGIYRPAAVQHWVLGIEQMMEKPPSGQLQNHNYLRKIVFDIAGQQPVLANAAGPVATAVVQSGVSPVRPREDQRAAREAWLRDQVRLGVMSQEQARAEMVRCDALNVDPLAKGYGSTDP